MIKMNFSLQQKQANSLRKMGKYAEALSIYENLWKSSKDKFVGAGLLHCLRKLSDYERALKFAMELEREYVDFEWCRNEIIWTYIEGKLLRIDSKAPIDKTLSVAQKILNLGPNNIALQKVVFRVLKVAKKLNKWNIVQEWIDKINPDDISNEPIKTIKGTIGWSMQSLWYYYKIYSLLESKKYIEVIEMADAIRGKFPLQQEMFFVRLKALAYYKLGDFSRAEEIYSQLCNKKGRVEWWLLYEYAKTMKQLGNHEDALNLMYKAISKGNKIESMVTLISDIGFTCMQLNRKEEAFYHIMLFKLIRDKNNWNVQRNVIKLLEKLSEELKLSLERFSYKEVLKHCKSYWDTQNSSNIIHKRKIRKSLIGKVLITSKEAPYCFIQSGHESFFCLKSNIPGELVENMEVQFDAILSFDKKKNRESWKAINVVVL
ncbi:tetratricopeptide repeat protein [Parageobacillus toebii]|uniref:tetratricopeptide repeat protein n=1 Tax=Parageobacillus toebii TaxID=153151 RepID=UPI002E2223B3|nr:tetratricopeptide repeat protein [Parageobacillus toebii]MED4990885.1 hypothetical protein [Parageobacillus toebii]